MKEIGAYISAHGQLPKAQQRQLDDLLRGLAGKTVKITVEVVEKPRSYQQNKFYHGPFIAAFQKCLLASGQRVSKADIHEGLRNAYAKNGYSIPLPDGSFLVIPPSTRRLSTGGFSDYLEEIRAEFARFGWELPLPGGGVLYPPNDF